MIKNINQRVVDSFSDSDHEDIAKYIDWLRDAIAESFRNIRRFVTTALLLMAVFEIIAQSPKVDVSFGGVHISRNSLVFIFIPALVAYLFLEVVIDAVRYDAHGHVLQAAFKRWRSVAGENDLHLWMVPSGPVYWNQGLTGSKDLRTRHERLEDSINATFAGLAFFVAIVFEVQAYYVLFSPHIGQIIAWSISILFSLIFLSCAIRFLVIYTPIYSDA